ncbi:cation:dicarboxylase symporter family transporter [Parahaliea maris]|uniref:Cation:dicarboxylase symporter family transporter n=1 Tax=Parahaliea maris TaxID=2716870 RepID=A0A5C8ZW42_9GAMM|nr:cation:dicarboxylase symporter family transporter [Parahaliea maris]TXS92069.1 cation:dicarboxylase symporter family transporter [Parahaliea maris]
MRAIYNRWRSLGLSARILVGLGVGIGLGAFFGERATALQPVGDIYIRLMQMTVLPYLITSLVIAFGQLEVSQARRLALRGGGILLVIWLLTAVVLMLFPLAFPEFTTASFYSEALVEQREPFSFTDIYFTNNPFASLSGNVVPAIVLFSCLIGIGLMTLPDKEKLLDPMRIWNAAIVRVTHFVIDLTPVGVMALAAVLAGTITMEAWLRLEVYFVVFGVAALVLAFLILPLLVTAVTPFSYREVVGVAKEALLTAFIANSAFIVLPILIDRCKHLLERHGLLDETSDSAAEVMIPVMFNFPNAGKLLTLLFIPFAAWLSGAPLPFSDYPTLLAAGIPSYFAKAQMALPFLIDLFGLPQDLFQLYIPTTILTGKFDSLVTAVNLIVFALLAAAGMSGFLVFETGRILRAGLAMLAGLFVAVIGTGLLLGAVVDTSYNMDKVLTSMHKSTLHADTIVHTGLPEADPPPPDTSRLAWMQERGSLRIGFAPDNLPMSFFNRHGELVGFDIELSEDFAESLGLRAEFVPVEWPAIPELLKSGVIDIMPGIWYRPFWFSKLQLSDPYFTGTVGLATLDHRRHDFRNVASLRQSRGLVIGVPLDSTQIRSSMEYYFDGADVEFRVMEFWGAFFEGADPEIDAFLMPVENASAWSLLYPDYTVIAPQPNPVRLPSAFGLAIGDAALRHVINEWIIFADNSGLVQRHYDYWILGEGAEDKPPRWSIMENWLGWRP